MSTKKKAPGDGGVIEGSAEEVKKKKTTNPVEFFNQVLAEGRKVTWTSRNETLVSTIMVIIMAIFFLGVDWVLSSVVSLVLSLG